LTDDSGRRVAGKTHARKCSYFDTIG
jgi:hypothetical protein